MQRCREERGHACFMRTSIRLRMQIKGRSIPWGVDAARSGLSRVVVAGRGGMPRELADVQVVSRMPVPSSHLYSSSRSSHLYSSTSSLRSTSLDRRSATLRESSSSSTSSSSSASSYISRLPPRPSFEHRSKVVSDLPRLSSRVVLDVSSGSRRSLTRQRSGDAISDAGSPVLTRYRDLGTDSPSSRASSPARRLLDENCNRASTPTRRLDWNHNVYNGSSGGSHSLPPPPDSPGRDSGASISPASSRHWRNLGSSTSSVDSGGSSSSDCSPGLRRARRLSLTSESRLEMPLQPFDGVICERSN
ncbi:hypothetical protein HPB50_012267 [Hyalomma asiaticum]|uniref:Uncharacterized protein n=1 Tax=Hyalomma asiaticum TaxID=266040 RepID=A0ACB7S6K7_HYAAI|nr:hypothetical protein HPB50_012267 [Hyalomma asiaticum]